MVIFRADIRTRFEIRVRARQYKEAIIVKTQIDQSRLLSICTHMSCQIEVGMVCEVDWCRLRTGCGVVDDELVVVRQFVRDCRAHFSRETFLTIRTHARQLHFVTFYRSIPNFLRNQRQRVIQINERFGFNKLF